MTDEELHEIYGVAFDASFDAAGKHYEDIDAAQLAGHRAVYDRAIEDAAKVPGRVLADGPWWGSSIVRDQFHDIERDIRALSVGGSR